MERSKAIDYKRYATIKKLKNIYEKRRWFNLSSRKWVSKHYFHRLIKLHDTIQKIKYRSYGMGSIQEWLSTIFTECMLHALSRPYYKNWSLGTTLPHYRESWRYQKGHSNSPRGFCLEILCTRRLYNFL